MWHGVTQRSRALRLPGVRPVAPGAESDSRVCLSAHQPYLRPRGPNRATRARPRSRARATDAPARLVRAGAWAGRGARSTPSRTPRDHLAELVAAALARSALGAKAAAQGAALASSARRTAGPRLPSSS